ncbi:MAG: hypothetical protein IKO32_11210 [Lachnospiraceae bacterium]|nr:hypothetical protein [Lachnospiraceae bacterium]
MTNEWIIYDGSEEPEIGDIYVNAVDDKIRVIDSAVQGFQLTDGTKFCMTTADLAEIREKYALEFMMISTFGQNVFRDATDFNNKLYGQRIYAFLKLPKIPGRESKEADNETT